MKYYMSKIFTMMILSLVCVEFCQAGVSVIVNPSNSESITDKDITRIYLGKKKTYASGKAIKALQLNEGDANRTNFVKGILKKSERQYKAYWAKLLFTGKGKPPAELSSDDIKAAVVSDVDAIGFIDSADVDESVKVVYELP